MILAAQCALTLGREGNPQHSRYDALEMELSELQGRVTMLEEQVKGQVDRLEGRVNMLGKQVKGQEDETKMVNKQLQAVAYTLGEVVERNSESW